MSFAEGAVLFIRWWRWRRKEVAQVRGEIVASDGGVRLLKFGKVGEVGRGKGFIEGRRRREGGADGGGGGRRVSH